MHRGSVIRHPMRGGRRRAASTSGYSTGRDGICCRRRPALPRDAAITRGMGAPAPRAIDSRAGEGVTAIVSRIMVVDDAADIREILVERLGGAGPRRSPKLRRPFQRPLFNPLGPP